MGDGWRRVRGKNLWAGPGLDGPAGKQYILRNPGKAQAKDKVKKSENLLSLQPKNMFCVILQKYSLFPELTVAWFWKLLGQYHELCLRSLGPGVGRTCSVGRGAAQDEGMWGAVSSYVMAMPGVGFGSGLGAEHLTLHPRWYQSVKKMVSFNAAGLSIEWDNIAKCWQAYILKFDSWLHHLGNFH